MEEFLYHLLLISNTNLNATMLIHKYQDHDIVTWLALKMKHCLK